MSKKDYEALAKALHAVKPDEKTDDLFVVHKWLDCVESVARVCEEDNIRFEYSRFINACHGK